MTTAFITHGDCRLHDMVIRGKAASAFCNVRPPGHHAERARAMGFCLFNNVAAAHALDAHGLRRVAVVDFDVHHGNGTDDIFRDDDMAMLNLVEADYAWVTERVKAVAARHASGRIVSVLEGGHELHALGRSVAAHLKVMSGL